MRGEMNMRSEGVVGNRMGSNKGDATPNPSLVRQPPVYQRLPSNDSVKSSDKDVNGNSGMRD